LYPVDWRIGRDLKALGHFQLAARSNEPFAQLHIRSGTTPSPRLTKSSLLHLKVTPDRLPADARIIFSKAEDRLEWVPYAAERNGGADRTNDGVLFFRAVLVLIDEYPIIALAKDASTDRGLTHLLCPWIRRGPIRIDLGVRSKAGNAWICHAVPKTPSCDGVQVILIVRHAEINESLLDRRDAGMRVRQDELTS
jgi:hypothetical protein